jgi:hypothetical protein
MVAGASACDCPDCGVVCPGKFSGCQEVWTRGPVKVSIGVAQRNGRANGNGSRRPAPVSDPVAAVVTAAPAHPVDSEGPVDLRPVLQAMWAELQVLNRRVDQLSAYRDDRDEAATRALEAAGVLPDRIVRALAAALQGQHRTIMGEVHQAIAQGVPDARGAQDLAQLPDRLTAQLAEFRALLVQQLRDLSNQIEGPKHRRRRWGRRARSRRG